MSDVNNQQPQQGQPEESRQPYQPQPPYQQPPQGYQPPYQPQPPQGSQPNQPPYGQPPYGAQPPYQQPPYQQPYNNQPPYQPPYQPPQYVTVTHDNTKAFNILSYIYILWLIGLLADKNNPRVKFHVNQGIILFIFEIVLEIAKQIVNTIIGAVFFPGILNHSYFNFGWGIGGVLMGLVSLATWALPLILAIIGIVHAAQDKDEPLPIIGKLFTIVK